MKPKLTPRKSLNLLSIKSPIIKTASQQNTPELEYSPSPRSASSAPPLLSASLTALRNYYDDFTTIDWARAFIDTNRLNYELKHSAWIGKGPIPFYTRIYFVLGRWILIVLIALVFALVAFTIDKFEILLVGIKHGYCKLNWLLSQVTCCTDSASTANVFRSGHVFKSSEPFCQDWVSWSSVFHNYSFAHLDFFIYVGASVILALVACLITLLTRIVQPTSSDLGAGGWPKPGRVMYTACGLGVPEVKTILSGFVIRRFLGSYALFAKTITLVLAIASGMLLGKEGPYVHLAACVGNVLTRYFPHINENDALKKQILCASALAGVALAFGSPLGGVLFILEEINHYLPTHQLFQIFFCAISSTLFLKFLNPYGTGKTVLFELNYTSDWKPIELVFFVGLGVSGGIFGALFVKFVTWWPRKFRQTRLIKNRPVFEVFCIAFLTGVVTFWNPYTKQASLELVLDLATPCNNELDRLLCPQSHADFRHEVASLVFALVVKVILTFVTFGLKLPCGIYVPSMVAGALYGRLIAMLIQWANLTYNDGMGIMSYVCSSKSACVDLGIYSMISAGAFMAGVTRMNITLVTILFELTSSYNYVLPILVSIAVANWAGASLEEHSLYDALLIMNDYPFMTAEHEAIDPFVTAGNLVEQHIDPISTTGHILKQHRSSKYETSEPSRLMNILSESNPASLVTSGVIDISKSPYVSTAVLQEKLEFLASQMLLDGCVPLVNDGNCVGLIFYSDLELCLDNISRFKLDLGIQDDIYCRMALKSLYQKDSPLITHQEHFNNTLLRTAIHSQSDYFSYGTNNSVQNEVTCAFRDMTDLEKYVDKSPIFLNHTSELVLAHLIFDKIGNRVIVLLKDGSYYGVLHKKALIDYCRKTN